MAERSDALPPSFSRLLSRVLGSRQPLVRLWGWPGSGTRELLDAVESELGDRCLILDSSRELDKARVGAEPRWILCHETPPDADLLVWADCLGPERRLVYPARRRSLTLKLPEERIEPTEFLLRQDEWRHWAARARPGENALSQEALRRVFEHTEGWLRPLRWFLSAPNGSRAFDGGVSEVHRSAFERQILSAIDSELREVLRELATFETIDLDAWRLVWHRHPGKLATLEELRYGWGLLLPTSHTGIVRLPRLMKEWVAAKPVEPDRWRLAGEIVRRQGGETTVGLAQPSGPTETKRPRARESAIPLESLHYEIQLLGDPMVWRRTENGERMPLEWTLKRAFRTFAFLALSPDRRADRDELIEAIWNDVEPERTRRNFHPTLSLLRRTLAGGPKTLRFRQGQYTLDSTVRWEVDVETFEALIREGESRIEEEPEVSQDLWRRAWSLYRGPLLGDEEAPWARRLRDELRRRYLRLLRDLGGLATRLGNETLAIDALRSVLLEEPFEERIHLAIMELYSAQGRRDLVRRQYVRLQELLLEELSVEPMSETQEQYHRLMR